MLYEKSLQKFQLEVKHFENPTMRYVNYQGNNHDIVSKDVPIEACEKVLTNAWLHGRVFHGMNSYISVVVK